MRILLYFALAFSALPFTAIAIPADDLVKTARARTYDFVRYDGRYMRIKYPGGDVPSDMGVCSDVIIRAYRSAFGFDFQKAVHEDIKANFNKYPKIWGLTRPDSNIDHRRVPNLETYLERMGARLPNGKRAEDYKPGDLVTWRIGGSLPHIGIVSDKKNENGVPLIIHNIGQGVKEEEMLFLSPTHRHYRFFPKANMRK